MKTREILEFDGKEFYLQKKTGKKRIYQAVGTNPIELQLSYENGILKCINVTEINSATPIKNIKIRTNSKNNIEVSVEYKENELVEIDDNRLQNAHVNYKKVYNEIGRLIEEKLSIVSSKKQPDLMLKRLLAEKDQYINNKKIVMTVNTEKLELFEDYSDQLIKEFLELKLSKETKIRIIKEEKEEEIIEPTINIPYVVPSSLYIYDRIYNLESVNGIHLTYINKEDGVYSLEVKLDSLNQKVKEVVFTETKPKLLTEKNAKKLMSSPANRYERGSIVRLIPLEDGNIKGLYTSRKEDIRINGQVEEKTKTNGEGICLTESKNVKTELEITLKSGKLKVYSMAISYNFENEENRYYIVSKSYSKFHSLLGMSPYILNAIEDKIWVKTK